MVSAAAPPVRPCQERVNDATSKRPVCSLAMRTATSIDSPPVESRMVRSSPAGNVPTSASAKSSTGGDSIHEFRWITLSSERRIASPTRGWLWPMVAQIWPAVKSRMRRPSAVVTHEPSASTMRSSTKSPP